MCRSVAKSDSTYYILSTELQSLSSKNVENEN